MMSSAVKSSIILGIIFVSVISIIQWSFGEQKNNTEDTYVKNCGNIWCVQSIIVNENNILVDFQKSYHGVSCKKKDGTEFDVDKEKPFCLGIGDTIVCYGDHESEILTLKAIKDAVAVIEIREENRPPLGNLHSLSYKCKICSEYPSIPILE